MARVPISFYLNVLAGLLVLFHHYASSETGDVAFKKITGAIGRFSALFRDTAASFGTAFYHRDAPGGFGGLVGAMDSVFPRDAAEYHYCGASNDERERQLQLPSHGGGGYGGSVHAHAWVYHRQLPISPPFAPRHGVGLPERWHSQTFTRRLHDLSSAKATAIWDRFRAATALIGVLLLRTCAAWWWFRAPLQVIGVLVALWALGYSYLNAFVESGAQPGFVVSLSRVYRVAVIDFLQCIQWETQRLLFSDVGVVMMMELIYSVVMYAPPRARNLLVGH